MKAFQLIVMISLLLCCFTLQAQILKGTKWGILAGVANTNIGFIKPFTRYSTTGYKAGVFVVKPVSPTYELSLSLGLNYYASRSYGSDRFMSATVDTTIYYSNKDANTYLNFAPQLRYYLVPTGKLNPFVSAGLFLGYLINATNVNYTGNGDFNGKMNQNFAFSKLNHGVIVDLGSKVSFGRSNRFLIASVSYDYGLTNIANYPLYGIFGNKGVRTSAISLNVFYPVFN